MTMAGISDAMQRDKSLTAVVETILQQGELHFRTYLRTTLPLHASLVVAMCGAPNLPLELATTLEDIGQGYMAMADRLNREVIGRNKLDEEPEPDDSAEARISQFAEDLIARAGNVRFEDGASIDGRTALAASPVVADAIRTAILLARHERRGPSPG